MRAFLMFFYKCQIHKDFYLLFSNLTAVNRVG